jgi:uncharacterized OsmC-like protein
MYSAYASVLGIDLDEVQVECKGNLGLRGLFGMEGSVPPGFTNVYFETKVTSSEPQETIRTPAHLVESRCPVLNILARPVSVSGVTTLNGETLQTPTASDE